MPCTYGSEPRPGEPQFYTVTNSDLQRWFPTSYSKLSPSFWAEWWGWTVALPTFCLTEPEPADAPSDDDIVWASANPITFLLVKAKIDRYVRANVWAEHCQCTADPNDPEPCGPTSVYIANGPGNVVAYFTDWVARPQGATGFEGFVYNITSSTGRPVNVRNEYSIDGATVAAFQNNFPLSPGQQYSNTDEAWPSQYTHWRAWLSTDDGSASTVSANLSLLWLGCDPQPTYLPAPSEPIYIDLPDYPVSSGCDIDDVCTMLNSLARDVSSLKSLLHDVQRYHVPFEWVEGDTTVVSGEGTLELGRCVAVRIALTYPGWKGWEPGEPEQLLDVGRVAWGDGSAYASPTELTHTPMVLHAPIAYTDHLGYSLPPGVEATVTTLLAED